MVGDTKIRIRQIKGILDEITSNPDDYDMTKTAAEIYELARADLIEANGDRWLAQRDFGALDAVADRTEQ